MPEKFDLPTPGRVVLVTIRGSMSRELNTFPATVIRASETGAVNAIALTDKPGYLPAQPVKDLPHVSEAPEGAPSWDYPAISRPSKRASGSSAPAPEA